MYLALQRQAEETQEAEAEMEQERRAAEQEAGPTRYRGCTLGGTDEFWATSPDQFEARGYVVTGTFARAGGRPGLIGHPVLRGFCGPMWDGDAIRYESQEVYDAMT